MSVNAMSARNEMVMNPSALMYPMPHGTPERNTAGAPKPRTFYSK